MLLQDAIEQRDMQEASSLASRVPMRLIQTDVLPELTIESRSWFWQNMTDEDTFRHLLDVMCSVANSILMDAGFAFGKDFSYAPLEQCTALLVTSEAAETLAGALPPERYATLQIILRTVREDP